MKSTKTARPSRRVDRNGTKHESTATAVLTIESSALSHNEKALLASHEQTITNGLATFFEVGSALMAIKEDRLYRAKYQTFEVYCKERWGFGKTYAWRVIGAAERLKLLPDGTSHKPSNEFQMRPFLKLAPEAFPKMWKEVVQRARDGKITSKLIGGLIHEFDGERPKKNHSSADSKKRHLAKGMVGEILVLLHQAKHNIEKHLSEQAIEQLERIEKLLIS